ncbi:MAG: hypothetical protein JNM43_18990 [Planctomycetaceae bacterium]|nr:hypothetical protein [Planctomycetaceae bacterium]
MSQDAANPYAPPAPEEKPPELQLLDDTEFLFNENYIVGRDSIRLPKICVLSGSHDNLKTISKTLFWGYRGKIDVRYSVNESAVYWRYIMRSIPLTLVAILFVIKIEAGILFGILIVPWSFSRFRTGLRIVGKQKDLYFLDGFCPEFLLQIRHIVERS